jgi:hypothetical protein
MTFFEIKQGAEMLDLDGTFTGPIVMSVPSNSTTV